VPLTYVPSSGETTCGAEPDTRKVDQVLHAPFLPSASTRRTLQAYGLPVTGRAVGVVYAICWLETEITRLVDEAVLSLFLYTSRSQLDAKSRGVHSKGFVPLTVAPLMGLTGCTVGEVLVNGMGSL